MDRILIQTALCAAFAAFAVGCAAPVKSVPVRGGVEATALFAGEWRGDFQDENEQRHGTISFLFEMGRHTAEGEVLMVPPGAPQPLALAIEYLKVEHSRVSGKLESYTDPACNCQVETEFSGDLSGDFIVGTYAVRSQSGQERVGEWTAQRVDR
jgi:hypothetical protein